MTAEAPAALEGRDLVAGYGPRREVLHGVSVRAGRGLLVALLGENGSGKSTLLKVLAGVLAPASGHVLLKGEPLSSLPRRKAARLVSYLPQGFVPFFPAPALDVVLLGRTPRLGAFGRPSAADRAAAQAALEEVDAVAFADRDVLALSGGERQRVLLARVLAGEPEVLLLDEPTANLDPRHRFLVLELLVRRARAGATVVFSTHEVDLASLFADEAVLLSRGRIVASGPTPETLTDAHLATLFGVTAVRLPAASGATLVALAPGPG